MRAAIFDLDGTLTDTLDLVIASLQAALSPIFGREMGQEEVRRLFGPTEEKLIARATDRNRAEALERFFRYYEAQHDAMARIFPGVSALLQEIAALGHDIGVVTNKGRRSAEITLRRLGLRDAVQVLVTGDDVERPKPDPAGILLALRTLGADPAASAYVGDSPSDMRAARAAGVLAIGAGWCAADGLRELADVMASHPTQVVSILSQAGSASKQQGGNTGWTSRS